MYVYLSCMYVYICERALYIKEKKRKPLLKMKRIYNELHSKESPPALIRFRFGFWLRFHSMFSNIITSHCQRNKKQLIKI